MAVTVYTPDQLRQLAEDCAQDWPRLMFDGFGIMVSDEQAEAHLRLGGPHPRRPELGEHKWNWLSGGQRGGKTVFGFGEHADACLYKRGLDNTDRTYWRNYQYGTLAIAPTTDLTLRLWQIGDEVSKGSNESQYDRKARRARGGAFIGRFKAGKAGPWPIWRFSNGARVDFRSSEGYAYRLEGGQWWFITWDEWASQPDREIYKVRSDVLYGRARDHDAKIMPMAWPKAETERHLIAVIREIEAKRDLDSQVIYLDAEKAPWTNRSALEIELRTKSPADIKRTIKGQPAGGASIEFKQAVIDNLVHPEFPKQELPDFERYAYLSTFDLGLGHDAFSGKTWGIPIVGGRKLVTPDHKARLVHTVNLPGNDERDLDDITNAVRLERALYRSIVALDATAMGGLMAVRALRDLNPRPYEFKSRSNDRVWGNMRLAAIANGLECLSWGRPEDDELLDVVPWGLVEMPYWIQTIDEMANFDRDAKEIVDDEVWSILIGLWYIRRWWVVGTPGVHSQRAFDVRKTSLAIPTEALPVRRVSRDQRRRLLLSQRPVVHEARPGEPTGVRFIKPSRR